MVGREIFTYLKKIEIDNFNIAKSSSFSIFKWNNTWKNVVAGGAVSSYALIALAQ